jgi:hypothetical protein
LLFGLGCLFPFAGLQLLPACAVVLAAVLINDRPSSFKQVDGRVVALGGGVVAGVLLLWAWLALHGVVAGFVASTGAVGVVGQSPWAKLLDLPHVLAADKSLLIVILATALALALGAWRKSSPLVTRAAAPSPWPPLALALALPLVLNGLAKFPVYYAWMIYLPLLVALERAWHALQIESPRLAVAVVALAAVAIVPGLPLRLTAALASDMPAEASAVDALAARHLGAGDHVLTDFKAYYAVRATGATPYAATALQVLKPDERRAIAWLIARPGDEGVAQSALGGHWQKLDSWQPGAGAAWPHRWVREIDEQVHGLEVWHRVS